MPPELRKHVRYPEMLLKLQAEVYGLYHMTDPEAFYNREDLWTVATEVGVSEGGEQTTQPMQPNFVLMKLPGRNRRGVRGDSAVHAGQPQQSDRLDRRPQRRRAIWHVGGLQLSQDKAGRRPAADRGAHRSERAALRTIDAVESARLARAPRSSAGDSDAAARCFTPSRFICRPSAARCRSCAWSSWRLQDRLAYGPTFESAMACSFWRSRLVHDRRARFRGAGATRRINIVMRRSPPRISTR